MGRKKKFNLTKMLTDRIEKINYIRATPVSKWYCTISVLTFGKMIC